VFFGEVGEGAEDGAGGPGIGSLGFGVGEVAVGEAEVVGDGVDDEEGEVGDGAAGGVELLKRRGEVGVVVDVGLGGNEGVEVGEDVNEVEVGVETLEGGAEGVLGVVVGGQKKSGQWSVVSGQRGGIGGMGAVVRGHGLGGGEAGGEVEGEGGFAGAGVSDEEGDFAAGDAVLPEPFEGFGGEGGEAADGEDVRVEWVLGEHEKSPFFLECYVAQQLHNSVRDVV
jgi:hypothetical protein